YLWVVTDATHRDALTHLSAAETRLSDVLARPRFIAIGCIVALTVLGWLALALMGLADGDAWRALCQPARGDRWSGLAVTLPMWAAMTLAMMLPTAGPMILTYAEIADTAAAKRELVVSPLVLTAGYVAVWLGFAVVATALQWVLAHVGLLEA